MKVSELRKLSLVELKAELSSAIIEYKRVKLELKSGKVTSDNINKARQLRKKIARIKTIIKEIEILNTLNKQDGTEK